MEKAIFKYNGGLGALLCSSCRVIMKIGSSFTDEEIMAIKGKVDMPPQYCKQCKPNIMTTEEIDKFAIEFYRWMAKNDTMENAEKYFHYTHKDMLNEFKKHYEK